MSQCKRCQKDGLRWVQTDGKWRLYAGDTLHVCQWTKPPVRTPQRARAAQSAFTAGVAKWEAKQPPKEPFPREADGDWQHPYWAFTDYVVDRKIVPKNPQQIPMFSEMVP
jgi:hypothetical protein